MKTAICLLFLTMAGYSWSQLTYVPDDNFEAYLEQIGIGNGISNDNFVSTASISSITGLNLTYKNINDLTGIEDFTSLKVLKASQNPFTVADLSSNQNLLEVEMLIGNLSNLNVTGCTLLKKLNIRRNPISTIDLTTNIELIEFRANECNFSSIDLSQNTLLERLDMSKNNLTSISVSNNPALIQMSVDRNNISSLDLTNNPAIEIAFANFNNLHTLTLGLNPVLHWLAVNANYLTSLDLTGHPSIKTLMCVQNLIPQLDLSQNINLEKLYSGYNPMQTLLLPATSTFDYFDSPAMELSTIDVSMCPSLRSIRLRDNLLTSIDVSNCSVLRTFEVEGNQLTELNVQNNPSLYVFACFGNDLTCLQADNGNNHNIARFWAYSNPNLTCIQVDDPNAAYLSGSAWNIDAQSSFSSNCTSACNPCDLTANAGNDVTVYPGVATTNSPCGGPQTNFGCTDLTATPSNGTAPFTYSWSTGETTQTITACPTVASTYTVTITDANGCTATDDVMVNTCDITTNNGNKVQVVNSQGNVISINIHALGAHLCNGGSLATGSCGGANRTGSSMSKMTLTAFPNPSNSGEFTLQFSEFGQHDILVTDVQGRTVMNSTIEGSETQINLAEFGRQMYFLKYFDGENYQILKLIH